jgi:hypothetical protein
LDHLDGGRTIYEVHLPSTLQGSPGTQDPFPEFGIGAFPSVGYIKFFEAVGRPLQRFPITRQTTANEGFVSENLLHGVRKDPQLRPLGMDCHDDRMLLTTAVLMLIANY